MLPVGSIRRCWRGGWLSWQRYQAVQAATAAQPVIIQPTLSGRVHIEYLEGPPLIGPLCCWLVWSLFVRNDGESGLDDVI